MTPPKRAQIVTLLRRLAARHGPQSLYRRALQDAASELDSAPSLVVDDPDHIHSRERVHIRPGWYEAGKLGTRLGPDIHVGGQSWTPVLWDSEDDPTFHKTAGLVFS